MKKIYEATGKSKKMIIEVNNDYAARERYTSQRALIGVPDLALVTKLKFFPSDGIVDTVWTLNGLNWNDSKEEDDIIIVEPLLEQLNSGITSLLPANTTFDHPIQLSKKATILVPLSLYEVMSDEDRKILDDQDEALRNIRFYTGDPEFATEMLLNDKKFIYLSVDENGYHIGDRTNVLHYANFLLKKQQQILEQLKEDGKIHIYTRKIKGYRKGNDTNKGIHYRRISGLTEKVEGEIQLDENVSASTNVGKIRENQEDAILLIRDKDNPKFKMVVVADGMGGLQNGEVASSIAINELKDWFENLSDEQKKCFETGILGLQESLIQKIGVDIQTQIEASTWKAGGTTLVCALIGKKETLIVNIGDSRAYKVVDGKLIQISREDTVAQKHLEEGITPSKEASRFDSESNVLLQCLGMDRIDMVRPHIEILDNREFDMLLLFTDGVTDCLSDEDIAIVCRTTDKKVLAGKIVEKALKHDSVQPKEFAELSNLNSYIPAGKDNTSAAVIIPERE